MAKVFLSFNQSHIEVNVDHHDLGVDWEEIGGNPYCDEAQEAEQEMIRRAIAKAEEDGHDLTEMYDAVVGDF